MKTKDLIGASFFAILFMGILKLLGGSNWETVAYGVISFQITWIELYLYRHEKS